MWAYLDLIAAAILASVAVLWVGVSSPPLPIRIVLVGSLLLFLPGYATSVAIFPRAGGRPPGDVRRNMPGWGNGSIDELERLVLSIGLSVAALPIVGVALAAMPWAMTQALVLLGCGAVTGVMLFVAFIRRIMLAPAERYVPPLGRGLGRTDASAAVSITLAVSVIIAVSALGFVVAMPQFGEPTTELYVLGWDEDGDPTAANYPETVELDDSIEVNVGIENEERETVSYILIVQLERLDEDGSVDGSDELTREEFQLEQGETWHEPIEVSPTMAGEDLRVSFLLYRDEPHFFIDQRTAYRDVHIWVDVDE